MAIITIITTTTITITTTITTITTVITTIITQKDGSGHSWQWEPLILMMTITPDFHMGL